MQESLRSPNVHTPKDFAQLQSILVSYPEATYWAGGGWIMSRPDCYPMPTTNNEIIWLGEIEEMTRFQRNDRVAEFGAMVSLNEILTSGKNILPGIITDNIRSLGGTIITEKITLGGALATKGFRSSIAGTLAITDTSCEIKYLRKKRLHSKWVPLSTLYDKNGNISLPQHGLISRVRIQLSDRTWQRYRSEGSFLLHPENAVSVAFSGSPEKDTITDARLSVTYPNLGFVASRDMDNMISSVRFPLNRQESQSLIDGIMGLVTSHLSISPLQRVRTLGILRNLIGEINIEALSGPLGEKG